MNNLCEGGQAVGGAGRVAGMTVVCQMSARAHFPPLLLLNQVWLCEMGGGRGEASWGCHGMGMGVHEIKEPLEVPLGNAAWACPLDTEYS